MSLVTASIGFTIKVNQGSDVHLPCYFPQTTQVDANAVWFKEPDKRLITEDDDNKKIQVLYPLDRDQTVLLRDIDMADAGIYHCKNADGEKLSTVYLIVEGRFGNLFYMLLHVIKVDTTFMYILTIFSTVFKLLLNLNLTHAKTSLHRGSLAWTRTVAQGNPYCKNP